MRTIRRPNPMCVLVLMCLGGPLAAHAQPQRRGLPAPKATVLPADPVDIAMYRFNRLPAVEARINGRGPYRLIVDTGAAGVVLGSDLATELGLKSPPGMPDGMVVQLKSPGNTNIPATLVHIDKLTLGEAEFQGIWTVATALPFGRDMHGVIGMNVFHECLLTYDYPGERIRLASGELPKANGRDILAFQTSGGSDSHPLIDVGLGGKSAKVMIDTGMRGWFSLPLARGKRLGLRDGPVPGPKALFVGGSRRNRSEGWTRASSSAITRFSNRSSS